jgi:N-acetylmuramoyl-L-alanine amidase
VAAAARLKRRLLRELVADNLALRSRMPAARGLRRRRPFAALPILALALVPAGWALAAYLAGPGGDPGAGAPGPVAEAAALAGGGAPGTIHGRAAARPAPGRAGGTSGSADGAAREESAPLDPAAFPLAVERVVLDPGHGGDSIGTRTPSGLSEKELALDIAVRVREFLERRGLEVVLTRDGDADLPLAERARRANDEGADLFVSIHLNWIENRLVRGVETYYLGPTDDPFLTQLAAAENRDSGYSLADLKRLVEEVYVGVRQQESRRLAEHVQASLLTALRGVNPGVEDRGVKTAPFIVLMTAEMPAILAEVSCLSNEREAELLARPLYREHIAEAVAAGIRAYAESLANPDVGGMTS